MTQAPVRPLRVEPPPHQWLNIVLGRVCLECKRAQASDEYDDACECRAADALPDPARETNAGKLRSSGFD